METYPSMLTLLLPAICCSGLTIRTLVIWKYRFAKSLAFSAFLPSLPTTAPFFLASTTTIACFVPSILSLIFTSLTMSEFNILRINSAASSENSTSSTFFATTFCNCFIVATPLPIARPIWPLFTTNITLSIFSSTMQSLAVALVMLWNRDMRRSSSEVSLIFSVICLQRPSSVIEAERRSIGPKQQLMLSVEVQFKFWRQFRAWQAEQARADTMLSGRQTHYRFLT